MPNPCPHHLQSNAGVHWPRGRQGAEVECPGRKCLQEGSVAFELRGPSVQMVGMSQAAMEFAASDILTKKK